MANHDEDDRYVQAFLSRVKRDPENLRLHAEPGREFVYRPGQILVAAADVARVAPRLREEGFDESYQFGGTVVFRTGNLDADVPGVVARLREPTQWADEPVPAVQPHHIVVGFGRIMGHPGGPARPADPLPDPDPARADAGRGVTVGVCDTGIWGKASDRHPAWLGGSYALETVDEDGLFDGSGAALDLQAGHGTFVAGVVRQTAPGVRFDPEKALDPDGFGDEAMLATALQGLEPGVDVVNLSLGCVTMDNTPSAPLADVLRRLCREVVVVAAAGNAGSNRPSWPAAFKRVIGVAAVEVVDGKVTPATDSNFGPWVDACAPGRHVSTYVEGDWLFSAVPVGPFQGFAEWQGTSFAAPFVAGRIADFVTAHGVPAREAARRLLDRPRWHADYGVLVL
jgi:subtilisin family serine protease